MGRLFNLLDPARTGREAEQLEENLKARVVGQDEAVRQIVDTYQTHLAGMSSPGKPIGNLLFLGPTGTGKTRMVEALAESLVGDAKAIVKIDCGEYQHSHEIAKLLGSPPGYLGHRETHPALTQAALNQHHTDKVKISFVLFDEIEKASDSLWKLMLGILDKATLTLGDNSKVDFSQTIIFMTSNLGAAEMESLMAPSMGFAAAIDGKGQPARPKDQMASRISGAGVAAARRKFSPEFMNRIDRVVVFRPLGEAELCRILDLELDIIQQRIMKTNPERRFVFALTDAAKACLLREGTDVKYGARHLKRTIDRLVVYPLSNLIATEQVRRGDAIRADYNADLKRTVFTLVAEGLTEYDMMRNANGEPPAKGVAA